MSELNPALISEPGDDPTKMPDQQAASGQSYGNQDSLLGMLGSMQALPQPVSQMGAYAGALSGGISAMRGQPDPVQQIQQNSYKQQMGIVQMLNQMTEQQQRTAQWGVTNRRLQKTEGRHDAEFEHKKAQDAFTKTRQHQMDLLKWNGELLEIAPTEEARRNQAAQRAKIMENLMGTPVPPETIEGWVSRTEDPKLTTQITAAFAAAGDDPVIAQTVVDKFKLSPASAQFYRTMSTKDAFLKSNNVATTAELRKINADAQTAEATAEDKLLSPGFQGNSVDAALMRSVAEENFPGVPLRDLTKSQQKFVTDVFRTQKKLENSEVFEQKREFEHQLALQRMAASGEQKMAMLVARAEGAASAGTKPMTEGQQYTALKRDFSDPAGVYQSLAKLRRDAAAMSPQAWPKGTDAASRWAAKQYREKFLGGDKAVYALSMGAMDIINGQVGRQFYNDLGNRGLALSQATLTGTESLPTYEAFDSFLKNMQGEVRTKLTNNLQALEDGDVNGPKLRLGAKSVVARITPRAKEVQPGAPPESIKIKRRFRDTATGKDYEVNAAPGATPPAGWIEIR